MYITNEKVQRAAPSITSSRPYSNSRLDPTTSDITVIEALKMTSTSKL